MSVTRRDRARPTALTVKPTDHLALEFIGNHQTLDVEGDDGRHGRVSYAFRS